ncbi:MAG: hypothetical protein RLN89_01900 [Parvibaculum sp.]
MNIFRTYTKSLASGYSVAAFHHTGQTTKRAMPEKDAEPIVSGAQPISFFGILFTIWLKAARTISSKLKKLVSGDEDGSVDPRGLHAYP